MKPSFKICESEHKLYYKNSETENSKNRSRIKEIFFDNFDLFLKNNDFIASSPEMNLYDPLLFIFGGVPVKRVSVYLGPMLTAWSKGLFTEQCECKHISYIYSCGGSLQSGTVGWRYSYCPHCKKFFNNKKPGSVGTLYSKAKSMMDGNYNTYVLNRSVKIPLLYRKDTIIETSLSAKHEERVVVNPIETLSFKTIIQKLKNEC